MVRICRSLDKFIEFLENWFSKIDQVLKKREKNWHFQKYVIICLIDDITMKSCDYKIYKENPS